MIVVRATNNLTGKVYEVPIPEGTSITFSYKSASVLTIPMYEIDFEITIGNHIGIYSGSKLIWFGVVFVASKTIKAYCLLRYLKNKDVAVFENITTSKFIEQACISNNLTFKCTNQTYYTHPIIELDNKEYFTEISSMLTTEFVRNGLEYILTGHTGEVLLQPQSKLVYNKIFNITDYALSKSIDTDTFNQIVIYNKSKTKFSVKQNMKSISRYGLLRAIYVVDDTDTDLEYYATKYLELKNTAKIDLSITVIGTEDLLSITQGYVIPIIIEEAEVNGYFVVDSVTHKLNNDGVCSTLKVRNYTEELV